MYNSHFHEIFNPLNNFSHNRSRKLFWKPPLPRYKLQQIPIFTKLRHQISEIIRPMNIVQLYNIGMTQFPQNLYFVI